MRTITYTYDETNPTNKDYLIEALTESIDDCGAAYESVARYDIACPYRHTSDCLNDHERNEYGTKKYEDGCSRCKLTWLAREFDTYPSQNGVWELEE